MWRDLELRDVRVFLTLADELHFGRTAQRLGVTPSRVSQTIRTLERQLGGALFERTSRTVVLTALGMGFRGRVGSAYDQLVAAWNETERAARGVTGELRLGLYAPIVGGPHLLDVVKAFRAAHPACRLELIETGFGRASLDWLRRGDVDVLVMRLPLVAHDLVVGPVLSEDGRVVVVAVDHPLAGRAAVTYEDPAAYAVPTTSALPRELLEDLAPLRTPSGLPIRQIATHGIGEVTMRVAAGEAVHPTVVSFLAHYPHAGLVQVPLEGMPASRTALVWRAADASAAVLALARVVENVVGGARPTA